MGLIEKIRNLFKKEQVIPSTNITRYDTSSISIPKYLELSEEAKKVVDGYIEEVDFEKLDTLMLFADEMSEYANANTQLLLKLFFRITQKPLESELSRLTDEEIVERKLDALIQREEVGLYKQVLENLQVESTLRAVALEEIKRRESKRKFDFLRLFEREEREKRLKRKNQMELLERATERMQISKKTIEQQMAVVKIEIESEESIATSLDVYNAISNKDKDVVEKMASSAKEEAQLMHRVDQTLQMASLVIPQDADILKKIYIKVKLDELSTMRVLDKERAIKALAIIQRKLDVYAYTHRKDLEQLRQEVSEIERQEKTTKNREELLSKVNRIQTMYKIFGQYVTPEDLQSLYQAKFDVLTIGANEQEESKFAKIKDKEEMEYYAKIIEAKLEDILLGRNAYFANEFGINQSKAIQIVRKIIQKENGDYSGEKLLRNKRLMSLILAFDEGKSGIMRLLFSTNMFNGRDLLENFNTGSIDWNGKLPLSTIWDLEKSIGNLGKKNISPWIDFISLSTLGYRNNFRFGLEIPGEFHLPEGIKNMRFYPYSKNEYDRKITEYMKGVQYGTKIICPSTLIKIKKAESLGSLTKHVQIKFNENLEEIDDYAFVNWGFCDVAFPKSLKRIGSGAFQECEKLESVYINDGLEYIGWTAFSYTASLKLFSVPTHKIDIKSSIFGYGGILNPSLKRKINLRVRGLNLEERCLEQYLRFDIGGIKSIEIMDGENVAIRYNILESEDSESVVKKVEQLIQEYKQRRMNKPQQQDETR